MPLWLRMNLSQFSMSYLSLLYVPTYMFFLKWLPSSLSLVVSIVRFDLGGVSKRIVSIV